MNQSPLPLQLMWFRDDLRTADNPALSSALAAGPVIAVFILDQQSPGIRPLGGAAKWWLHHGLKSLRAALEDLGIPLVLRKGPADSIMTELARQTNAQAVHWNRRYGQPERAVDTRAKTALRGLGREARSYPGTLLHEPWELLTKKGTGYKVFTPFYNALGDSAIRPPLPAPLGQDTFSAAGIPNGLELEDLKLLPATAQWTAGLAAQWEPDEAPARHRLENVLESIAQDYPEHHDRPDLDGTSALSPALRWGHLGCPRDVGRPRPACRRESQGWCRCHCHAAPTGMAGFLLAPVLPSPAASGQESAHGFDHFDWVWPEQDQQVASYVQLWQKGRTGFGLVDAGMPQLWQTGWMHNRVRMVAASLLVKNLQVHWKVGERWFWDTLVDADIASNTANWQWVAGSGADAAPYFRVLIRNCAGEEIRPAGKLCLSVRAVGRTADREYEAITARTHWMPMIR